LTTRENSKPPPRYHSIKAFGFIRTDTQHDEQRWHGVAIHNENVKKNREVLGRLINVTCFVAKQELAFRGHNESSTSLNKGNYIELIHLLAGYDERLAIHLSTATTFTVTANRIQNDLVNSVADIIFEDTVYEIASTPFVAILLDVTTDIASNSQLSTVVRYVMTNGRVEERFLGFNEVSGNRSAKALVEYVSNMALERTKLCLKLMAGELNSLQFHVRQEY
jgi:hypothetical protein